MPSDAFYDDMYESQDRIKEENRAKKEKALKESLESLTLEEKVNFLIKEYIKNETK